jgi:hypothetical protein
MYMYANILGHLALVIPATPAMESAEEDNETTMLSCRYGKAAFVCIGTLLGKVAPCAEKIIYTHLTE